MFAGCNTLKEIRGINKFNSTNLKYISFMFKACYELKYLDLSNFNTSEVINMGGMFHECNKLKEIKGINKFNTNNVINMTTMFQECNELIFLNVLFINIFNY